MNDPTKKVPKPGQRVLTALRSLIVSGEIPDGARIAEIPTAERLGVSRMPVRTALRALALEGLVVPLGARGYAARRPGRAQAEGAVQVRGVLEGLAARLAAQRGDHAAVGAALLALLARCERLFADGVLDDAGLALYSAVNADFHAALLAAADTDAITLALAQNNHLPLASADAYAFDVRDGAHTCRLLQRAHAEHGQVARHVQAGEAEAAEAAMRAHALISLALEREVAGG